MLAVLALDRMCACNTATPDKDSQNPGPSTRLPIDRSIQPCEDFDGFANANWKKANPIPGTDSRWGAFNILDKENKEVRLKGIIFEIAKRSGLTKGSEEQQIADYYTAFLDTVTIEKRGLEPLKPYLDKINGIASLEDWAKVCGELQPIGVSTWVGFGVDADARNSKMNAVYGGQNGLSLGERSYYERRIPAQRTYARNSWANVDKCSPWRVSQMRTRRYHSRF